MAGKTKRKVLMKLDDYKSIIDDAVTRVQQDPNPLAHSEKLAALVNVWIRLFRAELESKDIKEVLARLDAIEEKQKSRY